MARKRTTLDKTQVVETANRMIAHLSQDGTRDSQIRREAIVAVVSQILLDGNAYSGFRYLNGPKPPFDNTRIAFYG